LSLLIPFETENISIGSVLLEGFIETRILFKTGQLGGVDTA